MIKRVVVAGSREYLNYTEAEKFIDACISEIKNEYELIFISGGCRGADKLGERYAKEHNFKIEYYLAEWDKYGKKAGIIRNEIMAKRGDFVICFWDGKSKGTKSMIKYAEENQKPLRIKKIDITESTD